MRTEREKRIAGNYQTRKTLCKRNGTPFSITQEEWFAAWRSHPEWESSGYIAKRDPEGEWTASNIHYEPQRAKAPNSPNHKGSRTLTVRQWIIELGGTVQAKPEPKRELKPEPKPKREPKANKEPKPKPAPQPYRVKKEMDAATKALLDAARNRVRNEFTYAQRRAERSGKAFSISGRDWMRIWRASPHALEPGHMVRPYLDEPWSLTNCEYVQGITDGRHRRKAKRLDRIARQ